MSTTTSTPSTRTPLVRAAIVGAGLGAIASLPMAMYAMVASLIKDTGLLTPLYHIASLLISPDAMMTSMEGAMAGSGAVHFAFGPAVVGAIIHMATGAAYGVLFAAIVSRLSLGKSLLIAAGTAYGAIVFAFSAWVGLPAAAALLNAGDPIANMASMAGWGTFLIEHLLFGLVLGALLAGRMKQ